MTARAMTMDAAIEGSETHATPRSRVGWRGHESPWVLAARAAAPWPVWLAVLAVGVPGSPLLPSVSQGVLAPALVLAAMVIWTHRPSLRSTARWITTIVGTGLMGELLANALTDMGRSGGITALPDLGRALTVWGLCAVLYEVAPIVAATSRVTPSERREPVLDVGAHVVFLALGAGAYAWPPIHEHLFRVSPWLAVAVALPFAAARCGPPRAVGLPPAHPPRVGALVGVAAVAWVFLGLVTAASVEAIRHSFWEMRWGVEAVDGVMLAVPLASAVLALAAAGLLFVRAGAVRGATTGTVTDVGDGGLTVEVDGEEPRSVVFEGVPPAQGATVTLLGVTERAPGAGPFRDGAQQWRAARAWAGRPDELGRALAREGAGWLAWGAASAFGVIVQLW